MLVSQLRRILASFDDMLFGTDGFSREARLLSRLRSDDSGQDLIEYTLLASFIGLVGVLAFQYLGSTMKTIYEGWDTNVQNQWETPPPAASGY